MAGEPIGTTAGLFLPDILNVYGRKMSNVSAKAGTVDVLVFSAKKTARWWRGREPVRAFNES